MTALLFIFIISAMHPTVFTLHASKTSLTHYCEVPSPIDHSVFNFTTMQDEHNDSIIRLNDKDYLRVHFCRSLKEPCNGKQDYAVCLHSNRKEIGVGKEPPEVTTEFEKIMFRYTGDKCNNTHSYTVDIKMKCNFSIKKIEVNLDILYNRDQCDFQAEIESFAACAKRKRTTCATYDDLGYYNLQPLMNYKGNYIVKVNENVSAILNVCHSLIYGQHFEECDHETMVCLVDETDIEYPRYTRLGNVNDYARFSTKKRRVYLDLSSDTPCDKEDATGLQTIKTTIEFICKPNAFGATNTLPEYVSGMGTCHYKFRWVTAAACSEHILIKESEVNQKPCTITDPLDNELFDLSTLEGYVVGLESNIGAVYTIGVCAPLKESNCTQSGVGVCKYIGKQNTAVSKGLANSNLMWRKEQIFLNYTDGMVCDSNRRSYTTIIFKCAYSTFVFIDDDDPCATIINWSTPTVCRHRCISSNYSWNLNILRKEDHNYHVAGENGHTEYHVNVCEPLFDEGYTNCIYGTGICKVGINDEGKRISETNLGSQESGLKTAEDGRVYVSFVNGSVCEEDNSKRISTEITFTCDIEIHAVSPVFMGLGPLFTTGYTFRKYMNLMKGFPVFKNYKNCKYDLIWNTSFVCPETMKGLNSGCLLNRGIRFINQTHLQEDSHFKVHRNKTSGTFNVNHCGQMKECNGTFICGNKKLDRKGLLQQVNIDDSLVAFKFKNESKCKKDYFYDSLIQVWCTVFEGSAESFLLEEGECDTVINWARNLTDCKENINESPCTAKVILITLAVEAAFAIVGITIYCCACRSQGIVCVDYTRNCLLRCMPLRRRPAEDQAAEYHAAVDQAAEDQASEDQAAVDQAVEDQAAENQVAVFHAAENQAAEDQAAENQVAVFQAAEDQVAENQVAVFQAAEDQAAENQVAVFQAAEDQAAENQVAVFQAAEDQAAENQAEEKNNLSYSILRYGFRD